MSFNPFENLLSLGPSLVLAIVSGAAIVWGLYGDRARGRRRCPRCWYDMTGAVRPTCPECGHTARHEKQFQRDRRRWRVVILGLLLMVPLGHNALSESIGPRWWMTALPSKWLIAAKPLFDAPDRVIYRELQDRMVRGELDDEAWEALFARVLEGDGGAAPGSVEWEIKYGAILLMHSDRFMQNPGRAASRLQLPPRIDLVRASPLAPGMSMGVDVQLRHWWPRGTDARLTIVASAGGLPLLGAPVVVRHRDQRNGSRPFPLTIPPGFPDDADAIDIEVVVERLDRETGQWQSFPIQRVSAAIDRIESISDRLAPFPDLDIDARLGEIFDGRVSRLARRDVLRAWRPLSSRPEPAVPARPSERRLHTFLAPRELFTRTFDDLALGLTIDLLRDGVVVHTVQVWGEVGTNRDTERFQHLHSPDGSSFVDAIGRDGAAWTIRVRGDQALALRVPGAAYSWEGEFVHDVIVNESQQAGWLEEWTLEEE